MVLDRRELLDQLSYEWQPTNTIAKKCKANWHIVFGMLSVLYAEGYVETQKINIYGRIDSMVWRLKENEETGN